jgi:hypothetical protein
MDDTVEFDSFLKSAPTKNIDDSGKLNFLFDQPTEQNQIDADADAFLLYQIQGIPNTNNAKIVTIGKSTQKPTICLGEFPFKNRLCRVINYLLSDHDLEISRSNNYMNMISIIIIDSPTAPKNVLGTISLEFWTYAYAYDNISTSSNSISGRFNIFTSIRDPANGYIFRHHAETLQDFPTKNNIVYKLVNHLSHKHIQHLFQ